jgi:hypothetical protein
MLLSIHARELDPGCVWGEMEKPGMGSNLVPGLFQHLVTP